MAEERVKAALEKASEKIKEQNSELEAANERDSQLQQRIKRHGD